MIFRPKKVNKFGENEKILGVTKKKVVKKFGGIWPKKDDFRHISEII